MKTGSKTVSWDVLVRMMAVGHLDLVTPTLAEPWTDQNKLLAQTKEIRDRMVKAVEDFAYKMMAEVLNSRDTAPLALEAILKAGSYDLGPKVNRLEDPGEWTESKIAERASRLGSSKGPAGMFDD